MSLYAKLQKAYKNHRLLSGLKQQLKEHHGPLLLHDTHFSRAVPHSPQLLIYDCVDLPLMHQRTSKARRNRHKYLRAFIDYNAKNIAGKADIITLPSSHYEPFLTHWLKKAVPSILLRNFTAQSETIISPSQNMSNTLKSYPSVKYWMVIHNRIGGFLDIDGVLKALNKLPEKWGLCFFGVMDGENSKQKIQRKAIQLCPDHTVFCHDPIYGTEKLAALKCFDLGLVPLTLDSQNLKRCIPNRTFEFLSIKMPQLVSRTRPLRTLSSEYPDLVFVPHKQGQKYFEDAMIKTCEQISKKRGNFNKVITPNWAEDFDRFFKVLDAQVTDRGLNKDVVILSENNPQKNNRLSNIQNSLKKENYSVVILEIDLQNQQVIRHE